jgi:hypothetical protein
MLQIQRVNALGKQIGIEDPAYTKYAGTTFQCIVWMMIFDIVTIKRNAAVLQRYENNHCITTTKLLWRCFRIMSIIESFGPAAATVGGCFFMVF